MLYIAGIVVALIGLFLIWLILDMRKKMSGGQDGEKMIAIIERLNILNENNNEHNKRLVDQNEALRQTMDHKLSETHRTTQEQIGQSAKQIADVVAGLIKLEETNKQVVNFSAQLQNLQDILKNPKQRGVLGEYFLESVLKNVLPPSVYQMQCKLGKDDDGRELIVDAAIFINDKIIPIDSKFSLENYNKIIEWINRKFKCNLTVIDEYKNKGSKTVNKILDKIIHF